MVRARLAWIPGGRWIASHAAMPPITARLAAVPLLLALACACSVVPASLREAVAPTPPPPVELGIPVARGNWRYTTTKVERVPEFIWSAFGNREKAKGVWVIVSMTLTNIGTRNFGIGSDDFELRDAAGLRYSACTSFACSSLLTHNGLSLLGSLEQFPPGVDVRTAVSFDVNPEARGFQLILKQAANAAVLLGSSAEPAAATAAAAPRNAPTAQPVSTPLAARASGTTATPQALTCLTTQPVNLNVPWSNLASSLSSGSNQKAAELAAALVRKPLVLVSRGTSYPVEFRVSIQAGPEVAVFVLIPRLAALNGEVYPPYGRWEAMDDIQRRNFLLALLNDAGVAYPGTRVSVYIFRYDGSPLGDGANLPSLRFGVILPGFTNATCLPAPSATLRP